MTNVPGLGSMAGRGAGRSRSLNKSGGSPKKVSCRVEIELVR